MKKSTLYLKALTNVLIYMQDHTTLDPARLVSIGYGQWRPVDKNDTPDHRAHNRRVEFLITGKDIESALGDALEQYASIRSGDESENTSASPSSNGVDSNGVEVLETVKD